VEDFAKEKNRNAPNALFAELRSTQANCRNTGANITIHPLFLCLPGKVPHGKLILA